MLRNGSIRLNISGSMSANMQRQRFIHTAAIEMREDDSDERGLSGASMQITADWFANPCVKM